MAKTERRRKPRPPKTRCCGTVGEGKRCLNKIRKDRNQKWLRPNGKPYCPQHKTQGELGVQVEAPAKPKPLVFRTHKDYLASETWAWMRRIFLAWVDHHGVPTGAGFLQTELLAAHRAIVEGHPLTTPLPRRFCAACGYHGRQLCIHHWHGYGEPFGNIYGKETAADLVLLCFLKGGNPAPMDHRSCHDIVHDLMSEAAQFEGAKKWDTNVMRTAYTGLLSIRVAEMRMYTALAPRHMNGL